MWADDGPARCHCQKIGSSTKPFWASVMLGDVDGGQSGVIGLSCAVDDPRLQHRALVDPNVWVEGTVHFPSSNTRDSGGTGSRATSLIRGSGYSSGSSTCNT